MSSHNSTDSEGVKEEAQPAAGESSEKKDRAPEVPPLQEGQSSMEDLQSSVQEAVESEASIREKVRRLTVEALAEGKLDGGQVKTVVETVVKGASEGMETHGGRARQSLEEALKGLEDGLVKAAEASKLSLEEAASRADEFTEREVKQAFDQLVELEKLYIDTLADVAKRGGEQSREILTDLVRHARHSGTSVGGYLTQVMETLPRKLQEAGQWGFKAGVETARSTGAQLAAIASGFLAGIADTLDRQSQKKQQAKKPKQD